MWSKATRGRAACKCDRALFQTLFIFVCSRLHSGRFQRLRLSSGNIAPSWPFWGTSSASRRSISFRTSPCPLWTLVYLRWGVVYHFPTWWSSWWSNFSWRTLWSVAGILMKLSSREELSLWLGFPVWSSGKPSGHAAYCLVIVAAKSHSWDTPFTTGGQRAMSIMENDWWSSLVIMTRSETYGHPPKR